MKNTADNARDTTAVAIKPKGNPDGKGASAFALDWARSTPQGVLAKPRPQLLAEFFTSMLVLSASFHFRPVPGEAYFLYWTDEQWNLSLIAPDQWSQERREGFAGRCVLQKDMTWTIEPSDNLYEDTPVSKAMATFYQAFSSTLDTDRVLEDILPFYVKDMPYFQRLYASGLSRSMLSSMKLGDQVRTRSDAWRSLLPRHSRILGHDADGTLTL